MDKKLTQEMSMLNAQTAQEERLFEIKSTWETAERKDSQEFGRTERIESQQYDTAERKESQKYERQLVFDKMAQDLKDTKETMDYAKTLEVSKELEQQGVSSTSGAEVPKFRQSDVTSYTEFYEDSDMKNKEIAEELIQGIFDGSINPDVANQVALKLGLTKKELDSATKSINEKISLAGVAKNDTKFKTSNPNTVANILIVGSAAIGTPYK